MKEKASDWGEASIADFASFMTAKDDIDYSAGHHLTTTPHSQQNLVTHADFLLANVESENMQFLAFW